MRTVMGVHDAGVILRQSGKVSWGMRQPVQVPHGDSITFSGSGNLLKKYGIEPKKVSVAFESPNLSEQDKQEITRNRSAFVSKVLQSHEHALKNKKLGVSKFSNRQYASTLEMELDLGQGRKKRFYVTAGNFEMNISELICGERGGMTMALNKAVSQLPKEWVEQLPENTDIGDILKVKRLFMSSSKPVGEDKSAWQPCSDCYAWMGTNRFFSPATQIVSLYNDPQKGTVLEVRTQKDLLPRQGIQQVSMTNQPIESLPIDYSEAAQAVLKDSPLSEDKIRTMLKEAKVVYDQGESINEGYSGKDSAAAVLFHNSDDVYVGRRVEWVPRWPVPADQVAAAEGINDLTRKGVKEPVVKAIAYYGDHEDLPSIQSVGRLAQKRGGKEVILVMLENDRIQVRNIKDYQPHVHGSVRQLSTNRTTV